MTHGRMEIHTEQPMSFLLCGDPPLITSSRRQKPVFPEEEEEIDMEGFPDEITDYNRHSPRQKQKRMHIAKSSRCDMTNYIRYKHEENFVHLANGYVNRHSYNMNRKSAQIHLDWEDCYMQPLFKEIKRKMTGQSYDDFRKAKTRAKTAILKAKNREEEEERSRSIPVVRLSTSKLTDRVHKYQKNQETEERLTRFIMKSQGIEEQKPTVKERVTFDVASWKPQSESHIFCGAPTGKRQFPGMMPSKITQALTQFA